MNLSFLNPGVLGCFALDVETAGTPSLGIHIPEKTSEGWEGKRLDLNSAGGFSRDVIGPMMSDSYELRDGVPADLGEGWMTCYKSGGALSLICPNNVSAGTVEHLPMNMRAVEDLYRPREFDGRRFRSIHLAESPHGYHGVPTARRWMLRLTSFLTSAVYLEGQMSRHEGSQRELEMDLRGRVTLSGPLAPGLAVALPPCSNLGAYLRDIARAVFPEGCPVTMEYDRSWDEQRQYGPFKSQLDPATNLWGGGQALAVMGEALEHIKRNGQPGSLVRTRMSSMERSIFKVSLEIDREGRLGEIEFTNSVIFKEGLEAMPLSPWFAGLMACFLNAGSVAQDVTSTLVFPVKCSA